MQGLQILGLNIHAAKQDCHEGITDLGQNIHAGKILWCCVEKEKSSQEVQLSDLYREYSTLFYQVMKQSGQRLNI